MTSHELSEIMNFLSEYVTKQLGSGVHTSRVIRNSRRIIEELRLDVALAAFHKNVIISIWDKENETHLTRVVSIPALPVSFQMNSELSALSWEAYDEKLTLSDIRKRYFSIINKKNLSPLLITICVSFANASFCRLFGGDMIAMIVVLFSTFIGCIIKNWLSSKKVINYFIFAITSLIVSAIASISVILDCNANIALATSPLFLIPGVPLINGFIDIVEGHILIGLSRIVNALMLIFCIAVGLSITLMIVKNQLI